MAVGAFVLLVSTAAGMIMEKTSTTVNSGAQAGGPDIGGGIFGPSQNNMGHQFSNEYIKQMYQQQLEMNLRNMFRHNQPPHFAFPQPPSMNVQPNFNQQPCCYMQPIGYIPVNSLCCNTQQQVPPLQVQYPPVQVPYPQPPQQTFPYPYQRPAVSETVTAVRSL